MFVQGDLGPLFRPGLIRDFRNSLMNWDPCYTQTMQQGTWDLPEIKGVSIAGINRLHQLGDGEPIPFDRIKVGDVVQAVDKEFGIAYGLTRKAVEDDQYGQANQAAMFLGEAVNMTFELRAAAFWDDYFAGATFKGQDNLAFGSAVHTCLGNQAVTFSSTVTSPVALSSTGIEALLDTVALTKNMNGDPMKWFPDHLLIGGGQGQYHRALEIFGSELEPYTANNQINAIKKTLGTIKVIRNPHSSNQNHYFMFSKKLLDVHFLMKRKPEFKSWDDPTIGGGALLNKVTTRFIIWGRDPRGIVGANVT